MMDERPYYTRALAPLQAAHEACHKHPDRPLLGMSSGPFSGVNGVLGIVARLEDENQELRKQLALLSSGERPE